MRKILFLFLCLSLSITTIIAQERPVTGTVIDADGLSLMGAAVIEVGNPANGVTTDLDGKFTINVKNGGAIEVSYIGYITQQINVVGGSNVSVTLVADTEILDEVVVIGYGTQKRSSMTSSIATVSSKDINKQVSSNVAASLQGRAAGVDIVQQGGIAGADVNIVIRGAASLTGTDPLYIVDGVFTNSGLSTINSSDIASLQILKDGAAAAIYGSRAANGVVIITTKSGQKGDVVIDFNSSFSLQTPTNIPDFLNAEQWRTFANTVSDNSGLARAPENVSPTDSSVDTDWAKEWIQTAPVYSADLAISGGSDSGNYSISLGYFDQTGMTKYSDYTRYNARANSSFKKGRFTFSENVALVYSEKTPTATFNISQPNLPLTDEEGRYSSWGSDYYIESENSRRNHPFASYENVTQYNTTFDAIGGFNASVQLVDGLSFTTSFSGNYTGTHSYTHTPIYYAMWYDDGTPDTDYGNNVNSMSETRGVTSNYTIDNVFNYDNSFGKHNVSATLGHSWMREFYRYQSYSTVDDLGAENITGFSGADVLGSAAESNSALLSFFGRVNYDYDNRYLLSATIRRDESSKFAEGFRVGYFPSISGGWNAHNESWFKNDIVSLLKVTASYGELGANFLSPYNFDNIAYGPIPYTFDGERYVDGRAAYLKTQDLTWETSKTTDVGLEFGLLDNTWTFHVNYFHKKNVDLLASINLNLSSGQVYEINTSTETPYVNTASVENKGFEFMAGYHKQLTHDFYISVNANASTLQNKVLALGTSVQPITSGSFAEFDDGATITMPGYAIGSFYGYKIDGFDSEGNFAFSDLNGDGQITADDKTILGDGIPDLSYGLNIDMNYKQFDFSIFFNGTYGNEIFNAMKYNYNFNYATNMTTAVLDSWTPDNTSATLPIAKVDNESGGNSLPSEFYIEDGSYLRLKNIQLGYTFPSGHLSKLSIQRLRVYISAQNLFTLTDYTGYDPEVSSNTLFTRGVDLNSYPNATTYTVGVNMTF